MNTKNNKRKRASIDRIEKAFIELLQKDELDRISVGEVCGLAGINRSTFYANYENIYMLADSIREKLEADLEKLYSDEITKGYNSNDYLKLFRHIKENQIFYSTYFKLGYDGKYKIFHYDYRLAEEHFGGRFIDYHAEFFRSGITAIIKMWLNAGCIESPEDMFEVIKSEYRGREDQARQTIH